MSQPTNGKKRPTIRDVAEAAGVSRALVSIILRGAEGASEESRKRVLAIADEMDYRPDRSARMLRRLRTGLIGLVIDPTQVYHRDLIAPLYAAAEQHGYDLVLSAITPRRSETTALQDLLSDRCEGVVMIGVRLDTSTLVSFSDRCPLVVIGTTTHAVDYVAVDDERAMRMVVDHLLDLGHRSVVHLDGGDAPGALARRKGFETAMRKRGLEASVIPAGETELDGSLAVEGMRGDYPTAIAAFNDRSALGALGTLRHLGLLVPQDISVTGFDDSDSSSLPYSSITTAVQDFSVLAEVAVENLVNRIDAAQSGKATAGPSGTIISASLRVRSSTAPPRS